MREEFKNDVGKALGASQITKGLVNNEKMWGGGILSKMDCWGAWVAQSVKRPTSAQVIISQSVSSSPASGSGLMAQSLQPASDSVSPSLSAPPPFMLCLSLSQK